MSEDEEARNADERLGEADNDSGRFGEEQVSDRRIKRLKLTKLDGWQWPATIRRSCILGLSR